MAERELTQETDKLGAQPRKPRASGRLEMYSWLYMRVSGLLLIALVLIHFGIMHLHYGVGRIDFNLVAARYGTPFWRIYDLVLVGLALTHGLNGCKIIIDDYVHPRSWRVACLSGSVVIFGFFLVIGAYTILTFKVTAAGG